MFEIFVKKWCVDNETSQNPMGVFSLSQMVLYEQETKRGNCKKEKEREREWHTFLCLESRCIHTHDDMQTALAFKNN